MSAKTVDCAARRPRKTRKPMCFGVTRTMLPSSNQNSGWRSRLASAMTLEDDEGELSPSGDCRGRFGGQMVVSSADMVVVKNQAESSTASALISIAARGVTTRDCYIGGGNYHTALMPCSELGCVPTPTLLATAPLTFRYAAPLLRQVAQLSAYVRPFRAPRRRHPVRAQA